MSVESKLTYFKWFVEDAELMRAQLTTEQAGELFLAVMAYLRDGTILDVSPGIKWPYGDYQNRVNRSREVYDKKCATNAKNGASGGKAKAEKAKRGEGGAAATSPKKFTPPTKKQFMTAVEHGIDEGDISNDVTEYNIDELYDRLNENGWTISGEPLISRNDWETVISVNFPPDYRTRDMHSSVCHLYKSAFEYVFKNFHGLRDEYGNTNADFVAADFCEAYDEKSSIWSIQGEEFKGKEWKSAIEKFLANGSDP